MAFAPNCALLGVPSSWSSRASTSRCSDASKPISSGPIASSTASTALPTPLPPYRSPPSRSSTASKAPVEAPDGTAARPMVPSSRATSTSMVGFPRESRISRAPTASMDATGAPAGRRDKDGASLTAGRFGTGYGSPCGRPGRLRGMSDARPDYETGPARAAYHRHLPIGDRLSAPAPTDSPFFGFEGEIAMKPLEPMLVPERPRSGEHDEAECFHCGPETEHAFWKDELWHVGAPPTFGLPFVAGLAPNTHVRLDQMDAGLLASFGEIVQRLAGAIQALDGVARTHFSRWGD